MDSKVKHTLTSYMSHMDVLAALRLDPCLTLRYAEFIQSMIGWRQGRFTGASLDPPQMRRPNLDKLVPTFSCHLTFTLVCLKRCHSSFPHSARDNIILPTPLRVVRGYLATHSTRLRARRSQTSRRLQCSRRQISTKSTHPTAHALR
jgi:hypothetical protein